MEKALKRKFPKAGTVGMILIQQCRECLRIQNSIMPDGADDYPVYEAQCFSCGEKSAEQMCPPTFTFN